MTCHNCEISNEYSYKTISTTNESETVIADYSKTGNGAARITLLSPIDKTVTVTINANGGKYENFETTKILVEEGSTISLQIPIKANYVFVGWNISNNTAQINQNQLTVGEEDITITANWIHKSVGSYAYTKSIQEYVVLYDGIYQLEVWGAQGGVSSGALTSSPNSFGGYGGYSTGYIQLKKGDILYIGVGGNGNLDGYNGGGTGDRYYSSTLMDTYSFGGGATHIALNTNRGTLSNYKNNTEEILIVAGGGGGAEHHAGGSGGGHKGGDGYILYDNSYQFVGTGGNQENGGTGMPSPSGAALENINGSFGQGGSGAAKDAGAGGGGGFYGGGATTVAGGAGGGSGYIGNSNLYNKHMTCFNCISNDNVDIKTITTANVSQTPNSDYAKTGDGYAKITFIECFTN